MEPIELYNRFHPKFLISYATQSQQQVLATAWKTRMCLANPLDHDDTQFDVDVTKCPRENSVEWESIQLSGILSIDILT